MTIQQCIDELTKWKVLHGDMPLFYAEVFMESGEQPVIGIGMAEDEDGSKAAILFGVYETPPEAHELN